MYPQNLEKLILNSSSSTSTDQHEAQRKYESLAVSSTPGQWERYQKLKETHPDIAKKFISWSVESFYEYRGRTVDIPKMFDLVDQLVSENKEVEAANLIKREPGVMEWMMRSIICTELYTPEPLYQDEFEMFPDNYHTCKEFEGQYDYADYTSQLKNITSRTLILGGLWDHVSPIEAMQRISKSIPDNFFYIDSHSGHYLLREKPECMKSLISAFVDGKPNEFLQEEALKPACREPPKN